MHSPRKPKEIITISSKKDVHISYVQAHLSQPMLVIDPKDLMGDSTLTLVPESGRARVFFNEHELSHVKSIWFRKPELLREAIPLQEPYKDYGLETLTRIMMQLYDSFPEARWVSHYHAIRRANNKLKQLTVAQSLGFNVPDTIVTSNENAVKAFIEKHGTVIMKTLAFLSREEQGKIKTLFATKIKKNSLPNLANLHTSPAIFQQVIDKPLCDVRVTVVKDQVFAAKIITTNKSVDSPVRDWRIGHFEGEMIMEPFQNFPRDIADKCRAHAHRLGLTFSAIDLVMDQKKVFWFLENNPNGQWGFVERQTGLPIGKAVAELLSRP